MDWRDEYDSAIAERNRLIMALTATEKRAAELEARLAELERRPSSGTLGDLYDWIDRAVEVTADLKETIGKAVDVYEWRPVKEVPEKSDWRSGFIVATESEMVYYADEYNKGAWLWGDGWMKEIVGVTHWRPLPPPPAATE